MLTAITRKISRSMANCELTYLERQPIDIALARAQHSQYESALVELGCRVISLPEQPDLPDSVFVEDTAIVLDEVAIITRPGAESRRGETGSVAQALSAYRELRCVRAPASVDGGDVLRLGRTLFIGQSGRSNAAAVDQIRSLLAAFGYEVRPAALAGGCLHLKSAVTQIAEETLLVNPAWVDAAQFGGMQSISVDPSEAGAANALRIGTSLIYPTGFPRTLERLEARGLRPRLVEASETAKAEGAVTCCSLVFEG